VASKGMTGRFGGSAADQSLPGQAGQKAGQRQGVQEGDDNLPARGR